MDFSILVSPTSGPLWGFFGVIATVGVSWLVGRSKNKIDGNTAALNAINAGNKQLVDALFQQVKVLQEEVGRLRTEIAEMKARVD